MSKGAVTCTIAYALHKQILESVCKYQKNFLYAQLLTKPLDYMPLQMYK